MCVCVLPLEQTAGMQEEILIREREAFNGSMKAKFYPKRVIMEPTQLMVAGALHKVGKKGYFLGPQLGRGPQKTTHYFGPQQQHATL